MIFNKKHLSFHFFEETIYANVWIYNIFDKSKIKIIVISSVNHDYLNYKLSYLSYYENLLKNIKNNIMIT